MLSSKLILLGVGTTLMMLSGCSGQDEPASPRQPDKGVPKPAPVPEKGVPRPVPIPERGPVQPPLPEKGALRIPQPN